MADNESGPYWDKLNSILKEQRMEIVHAIEHVCKAGKCPRFTGAGAPGHHCSEFKIPVEHTELSCFEGESASGKP